jgi:hypothetical protein
MKPQKSESPCNPSVSGPDQGGLPSETLKSGSLEGGQSADRAERTVSRVSSPWLIAQMCRFKSSPERQPWSFGHISPITEGLRPPVTLHLWLQVIQMYPYPPLWKRGARGDFLSIILKSPFIPLCQRGIKTPETEGLPL